MNILQIFSDKFDMAFIPTYKLDVQIAVIYVTVNDTQFPNLSRHNRISLRICISKLRGQKAYCNGQTNKSFDVYNCTSTNGHSMFYNICCAIPYF